VNKSVEGETEFFEQADFEARLNHFVKFENWDDIPQPDRQLIDHHFLSTFIERHRHNVESRKQGIHVETDLPNDAILLLSEAEAMIAAAQTIVVQPCDCRRLGQLCTRPIETCIALDDAAQESLARGFGKTLTRQEAIDLLRWCHKKGLMHTADAEWRVNGLFYICNCCACDCYPFRAGRTLDSKGIWPKIRSVANYDALPCQSCGACVRRCHFNAFELSSQTVEFKGKIRKGITFVPERCWGCGLCVSTCPEKAITIKDTNAFQRKINESF